MTTPATPPVSPQASPQRLSPWPLLLPLLFQLAIVASIPLPQALIRATGNTVYLATRPVDPYDLLRGRYVTLDYAIERTDALKSLPGWRSPDDLIESKGSYPENIYIILAPERAPTAEQPSESNPPPIVWQPIEVAYELPQNWSRDRQALRARYQPGGLLDIGLTQYFIPEAIGDDLEADIRAHREDTVVEVKVNRRGEAALTGLWVEDRRY